MKIKKIFLIFIFLILDILIFFYFKNGLLSFRSYFWISHFSLALIFIYLNRLFLGENQFDIFILIFQIVGYVMALINNFLFFREYFKSDIEINENLEKYILNEEKEIIVNSSIDLNLIGAYDILAVGTPTEKKNFLIGFETQNLKFKVDVLKKALWDEDIEVIHYAATEINKIDENFQKVIKEKEMLKDSNELSKIYYDYCTSGLLLGEILEFYQNKYIDIAKSKENLDIIDKYNLLTIYKDMKDYKACNRLIQELIEKKDLDEKIVEFIEKYYYDLNDYEMLKEVKKWQKSV
ncbi:hypothetical protein HS141_03550 [Cetobacterium somerae]|uniref:hypothetical protein n=1 Tax=Cetobacterium somerae TaxID=188913 RepID=UPI00211F218E|nr:hypothetical protein [Cetobacterium somerae]MCQ9626046.1 hypothetical protein [Cetobacterium somerae]